MSEIKKGNRVDVDFISESSTEFSGNKFTGRGTVDLFEYGYVIGRLDDGRCFMCGEADVAWVENESVEGAQGMTSHYIQTLGVAKCTEILGGAPEWAASVNLHNGMYYELREYRKGDTFLTDLRHKLSLYDTDDFKHLANHLSPSTVVVENNLQEQFQEANEAECGR